MVPVRFRIIIRFLMLSFFLNAPLAQSQILRDTASINLLKRGIDNIYNFRFDDAREVSRELARSFPDHPVLYLLNGMTIYWENYPLIPSSPACLSYENEMRSCIRQCENNHIPADYVEYLLANLGARGMLLMYYADNNLSDNVFPLAKSTYRYLRQSFDYTSVYTDFYFFTGLYNYYREAYPDAHPVYKILTFLFPKGDRVLGLRELEMASKNSIMLKAESYYFLSHIYVSYENNYQQAYVNSKSLHELYPANVEYMADHLKNLLLLKKYDEAENLIKSAEEESDNSFFQTQIGIFNGILQEKKYHDFIKAERYYSKGLNDISAYGFYGNEYAAFTCFGLSRICDINNDKRNRKMYRKKATELTNYKRINFDD